MSFSVLHARSMRFFSHFGLKKLMDINGENR
jgi:hypothetical protein